MIRIDVNVDLSELQEVLTRLVEAGKDMTPLTAAAAGVMEYAVFRAFDQERDPVTGAAWDPLSPVTLALRKGQGKILQPTGGGAGLRASIQSEATQDRAIVGTNKKYASTHQFGAKKRQFKGVAPWGDVPARPFLGVNAEDEQDIVDALKATLHDAIYK